MNGARGDDASWRAKRRVTLIGVATNLVLAVGKIIGGVVGHSQALIADGIHSISDLASDALVLLAARWGSLSADHNHPYGHARIETAATAVIGVMLIVVAAGFAIDSFQRLIGDATLQVPGRLALVAAVFSVLLNEALFRYTLRVGRETGSQMIQANAWHSRSDALSSLVVIVGVLGAMAGVLWLDLVAAVIVAIMVGQMGWRFLAASVMELVDTGLTEERKADLNALIESVPGVHGHQQLRTRQMGGRVLMDVEILLDPELSLSQADAIARELERQLQREINELEDIVVRMRPAQ